MRSKEDFVLPQVLDMETKEKYGVPSITVLLDGKKVDRCVAYNVPMGTVEVVKYPYEIQDSGNLATETIRGFVKISWMDDDTERKGA